MLLWSACVLYPLDLVRRAMKLRGDGLFKRWGIVEGPEDTGKLLKGIEVLLLGFPCEPSHCQTQLQ